MWVVKDVCMNMGVCVCTRMRMSMREDASVGVNAGASVGASAGGMGTGIRVVCGHGWHDCDGRARRTTCARRA